MALTRVPGFPVHFPSWMMLRQSPVVLNTTAIDATDEGIGLFGDVYINGEPTGTKTLSAAGGGKIHLMTGSSVTFANAGTNLRVGIQDWSTTSGPSVEPDGTFDVYADWVGGTDTLTANTWTTFTMESGTKSIAHGDRLMVVAYLTARGGADSINLARSTMSPGNAVPGVTHRTTAWAVAATQAPIMIIEFDDGTLASFMHSWPVTSTASEAFSDATNPDERGLIFQVPVPCKVCGFWFTNSRQNADADAQLDLYSTPLGTPASMLSGAITLLGEQNSNTATNEAIVTYLLPSGSEVELSANTDYCVAIKATSTGSITLHSYVFNSANYRFVVGNNLRKGHRDGGSGAFTETTTRILTMGVLISHFDDGAGGGGGLITHPGMSGGMRG